MELTLDQRRAVALASARKRMAEAGGQQQPESPGILRRMLDPRMGPVGEVARTIGATVRGLPAAAEGIVNDINSAFQGANPVAAGEALDKGAAVGEVVKLQGMKPYVAVYDGSTFAPLDQFPAEQFATLTEGGTTYVIPKASTDSAGQPITEGRLASAGRLAGYGVAEQIGQVARQARPSARAQAAQDAEAVGVTPSFGMRGAVAGKVTAAGEQFAPTAGPFRRDAERVTGEIAGAAERIAQKAGPGVTQHDAGTALQRGGSVYVQGVRDKQSALYGAVDKAIPPETRIGTPETVAFLRSEIDKLAEVPNIGKTLGNRELEGWLADLEAVEGAGGIGWQTARDLRTKIGEALRDLKGPARDMATGRLKAIYGRLTNDLNAAAEAAGPEAQRAWSTATKFTRASEQRIDQAFGSILKADHPERAYDILVGMTAEGGGKANIDAVRRVFKSLPEEDRAVVAGTIIRRMGRATAGAQNVEGDQFSAGTFLTNWNRMSPEARRIIADGGLEEGVGEMLTTLARVVERAKTAGTFRNTSNTGNALLTGGLAAWLFADPVSAIAASAGARIGAEVLTNPKFLHALNRFATKGKADGLRRLADSAGAPGALEAATILRLQAQRTSGPAQEELRERAIP